MRLGMVTAMAKVIEFYTPKTFRKQLKWSAPVERGRIVQFPVSQKRPA